MIYVSKMFVAIDSEGWNIGRRKLLINFYGCDMRHSTCLDKLHCINTIDSCQKYSNVSDLVDKILSFGVMDIYFDTGCGEMIYNSLPLCCDISAKLSKNKKIKTIGLETVGSNFEYIKEFINISRKNYVHIRYEKNNTDKKIIPILRKKDQIKYVILTVDDLDFLIELDNKFRNQRLKSWVTYIPNPYDKTVENRLFDIAENNGLYGRTIIAQHFYVGRE